MFLLRTPVALGDERFQGVGNVPAGLGRLDEIVDQPLARGDIGVVESLAVLADQLLPPLLYIGGLFEFAAEDDLDGGLRAHDGDLGGRPRHDAISAEVLGAHRDVAAAVGLTEDHGDLRDGGGGISKQQLGAVADDAAVLLLDAGKEAGDIDEGDQGDVERIAEANEDRGLIRAVDIERAGEGRRLLGDDSDRAPANAAEADDQIAGELGVNLEEIRAVDDAARGGSSRLCEGRKESRRRQICTASTSFSATKWTTPALFIWARAPPTSSAETSLPVTWRMTAGPVMNMRPSRVWMTKSVRAGL